MLRFVWFCEYRPFSSRTVGCFKSSSSRRWILRDALQGDYVPYNKFLARTDLKDTWRTTLIGTEEKTPETDQQLIQLFNTCKLRQHIRSQPSFKITKKPFGSNSLIACSAGIAILTQEGLRLRKKIAIQAEQAIN